MHGRSRLLETRCAGCTDSRGDWCPEGHNGSPCDNLNENRCHQHTSLRGPSLPSTSLGGWRLGLTTGPLLQHEWTTRVGTPSGVQSLQAACLRPPDPLQAKPALGKRFNGRYCVVCTGTLCACMTCAKSTPLHTTRTAKANTSPPVTYLGNESGVTTTGRLQQPIGGGSLWSDPKPGARAVRKLMP